MEGSYDTENYNYVLNPSDHAFIKDSSYATISGINHVLINNSNYGTVSGGIYNYVIGNYGTVSGGFKNHISGKFSVIPGGSTNTNNSYRSVIAGGYNNTIEYKCFYGSILGGSNNTIQDSANHAAVLGSYGTAKYSNSAVIAFNSDLSENNLCESSQENQVRICTQQLDLSQVDNINWGNDNWDTITNKIDIDGLSSKIEENQDNISGLQGNEKAISANRVVSNSLTENVLNNLISITINESNIAKNTSDISNNTINLSNAHSQYTSFVNQLNDYFNGANGVEEMNIDIPTLNIDGSSHLFNWYSSPLFFMTIGGFIITLSMLLTLFVLLKKHAQ